MSVLMLLSLSAIAHAQGYVDVNTSSVIQPYYEYTSYNKANLDISGGQATCESTISGYSGITTKVTITMYLEKKTLAHKQAGQELLTAIAAHFQKTMLLVVAHTVLELFMLLIAVATVRRLQDTVQK